LGKNPGGVAKNHVAATATCVGAWRPIYDYDDFGRSYYSCFTRRDC
jgi:hypothetical protein